MSPNASAKHKIICTKIAMNIDGGTEKVSL